MGCSIRSEVRDGEERCAVGPIRPGRIVDHHQHGDRRAQVLHDAHLEVDEPATLRFEHQ
jgi:hypothetical protein